MGNDRIWKNQEAKLERKRRFLAARSAVEDYRRNQDTSGFPDIRYRIICESNPYDFSGYGWPQLNPVFTKEEYDRFEAAYRETPAGQTDKWYKPYEPTPDPPEEPGSEIL